MPRPGAVSWWGYVHKRAFAPSIFTEDNLETAKVLRDDRLKNKSGYLEKNCNQINESERFVTTYKTHVNRVVGRNEHYHNLRFRNACEEFNGRESCSDTSVGTEEYVRKKHRHRHRRKKKGAKFGYDIRDLDSFLSAATIDRPGNIPVVIAFPNYAVPDAEGLSTRADATSGLHEKENLQVNYGVKRQTLLVVNSDYGGNVLNKTLTVHKGDVVTLVQGDGSETDVDSEWFYVRKKDGSEGFIPAVVAGHGYI
ncbi:unnamed protein product [Parnassius apollo]|uniref:(apollo) hypothetical protein n=1 Tax=Parnassius apollo TaxID=110799 RepID=A0A8S3WBV8_PARAO|nr:unnamed protein product [Parnassius apollo]